MSVFLYCKKVLCSLVCKQVDCTTCIVDPNCVVHMENRNNLSMVSVKMAAVNKKVVKSWHVMSNIKVLAMQDDRSAKQT